MLDLSLQQIQSQLVTTFPHLKDISPISMLGDGWGSTAVEGNNGMVFRIAKNEIIQHQHKKQVHLLPIIVKELEGIAIPLPDYYIESSQEFPYGVMGYKKIEGEIFNPNASSDQELRYIAKQIAKILLHLHTLKIENGYLPQHDYSQRKLKDLWEKVADWLEKNLTQDEYHTAANWWMEAFLFYESHQQQLSLVHGDPWYENFILDESMQIKGIIDFDKISLGDKAIDFVVQQYVSTDFMKMVIDEYKKLGGQLGNNFDERVKLLSGIKRVEDLQYCLTTGYIYPNILKEIKRTIVHH